MNAKHYVSLEVEELLIEKGYPIEKNTPIYNKHGDVIGCYSADRLTKSEAIDWLGSKGMLIEIAIDIDECAWMFNIVDKEKFITICHPKDGEFFTDRLEAEEAAIIKALEILNTRPTF